MTTNISRHSSLHGLPDHAVDDPLVGEASRSDRTSLHNEIVYQIFPDRFRNGRPEITPRPGAWSWRGRPIEVSRNIDDFTRHPEDQYTFYGGDLEGIRQSLPYLADELGVTTIYLNPIFAAKSTHRYDTVDFLRIDSALGDRSDFEALARDLHDRGMKLMLDGVFNHTSVDHPWNQSLDVRKQHYMMRDSTHPMTWQNHGSLPKLNTLAEPVIEHIMQIIDAWPECDAWRLDAGHLLPESLLLKIRERAHPRPIIVEDWLFAPHYFDRGLGDAITNFVFRESLRKFFSEDGSPESLLGWIGGLVDHYGPDAIQQSWNLLDNHDVSRFISEVGRAHLLRAFVLQMTLPGNPVIFQGTEFGMTGKSEAYVRVPVNWHRETWDLELLDHVKQFISIRKSSSVFATGAYVPIYADNRSRTLAYARMANPENPQTGPMAIVALNDGYMHGEVRLEAGGTYLRPGTRYAPVVQRLADLNLDVLPFTMAPGDWRVILRTEQDGEWTEHAGNTATGVIA
ncbi:MAG: alpha-amylase family glycosyl hydrolase [Planctomycetota bacterium]